MPGYHFLIALLGALQGLTLVMLGLQGAYIGRSFEQSKDRPLYIVRDTYGMDDAKD